MSTPSLRLPGNAEVNGVEIGFPSLGPTPRTVIIEATGTWVVTPLIVWVADMATSTLVGWVTMPFPRFTVVRYVL